MRRYVSNEENHFINTDNYGNALTEPITTDSSTCQVSEDQNFVQFVHYHPKFKVQTKTHVYSRMSNW